MKLHLRLRQNCDQDALYKYGTHLVSSCIPITSLHFSSALMLPVYVSGGYTQLEFKCAGSALTPSSWHCFRRGAAFRAESYSPAPLLAQEVFASWRVPCKGAVACPPSGFGHCHAISASSLQGLSEAQGKLTPM